MINVVRLLIAGTFALSGLPGADIVLFNSFGPDYTYNTFPGGPGFGGGVPTISLGTGARVGNAFTPNVTATLTGIEMPVMRTVEQEFTVWLMSDVAGRPGAVLDTLVASAPLTSSITSAASSARPTLTAGLPYWVIAGPRTLSSPSLGAWWLSPSGATAPLATQRYDQNSAGAWTFTDYNQLAFRVTGASAVSDVPEPSSTGLLAFGLAGGAFFLRSLSAKTSRRRESSSSLGTATCRR